MTAGHGGTTVLTAPWAARRARAEALRERYPFAREPLMLYRALIDVQEPAWTAAGLDAPGAGEIPGYVAERVLPGVVEATIAAGPQVLADLARQQYAGASSAAAGRIICRWLDGEAQPPVERYLARAAAGPVLEALAHPKNPPEGYDCSGAPGHLPPQESAGLMRIPGDPGLTERFPDKLPGDRRAAGTCGGLPRVSGGPRDDQHCPACGGPPQLSYFAAPAESLAAGPRALVCARCSTSWPYPRLVCAACGEQDTAKLTVLAEEGTEEVHLSGSTVRGLRGRSGEESGASRPRFPHMRIDACTTCSRYLLSIDLGRDPRAIPLVDELAAIPLDLYAAESGFTKVVPNLMGA